MKPGFFLNLFLITILTSCHSQKNTALEEFKKIDSSLQKSSSITDAQSSYEQIQLKKTKYPELALQADSIMLAKERAFKFIDSLKEALKKEDPAGEKPGVGNALLINSKKYLELENRLLAVYNTSTISLDKMELRMAESLFQIAYEINNDKHWALKYFDKTPTIAAITILTKFKNDCSTLIMFTLQEMEDKIID